MNKVSNILTLIGLLSFTSLSWAASDYFTCTTVKGVLSLKSDVGHLIYEMKKPNGEGFYYSSPAPLYSGFLYNHYSRFQTDYLNVSFSLRGLKYTIFSNYEDGNSNRGVVVTNLKKKERVYIQLQG